MCQQPLHRLPWDQTPDRSDLKNNIGCVRSFGPGFDRANHHQSVCHPSEIRFACHLHAPVKQKKQSGLTG